MSGRGTIFEEYLVMFESCWAKPFTYVTRFAINVRVF